MTRTMEEEEAVGTLDARGRTATRATQATGGTRIAVAVVLEEEREGAKTARRGRARETGAGGTGPSRGLGRRAGAGAGVGRCTSCGRFRRVRRGGIALARHRNDRRWRRESRLIGLCRVDSLTFPFASSRIAREEAEILEQRFKSAKAARNSVYVEPEAEDESWERVEKPRRMSVGDRFRQNRCVQVQSSLISLLTWPPRSLDPELAEDYDDWARRPRSNPTPPSFTPPPPPKPPKPLLPPSKASRIAAWSASVPLSETSDLSLDDEQDDEPAPLRSAMKGGRARSGTPVSSMKGQRKGAVDDLDGVVEEFDPFQAVTTAQSAAQMYGSWVRRIQRLLVKFDGADRHRVAAPCSQQVGPDHCWSLLPLAPDFVEWTFLYLPKLPRALYHLLPALSWMSKVAKRELRLRQTTRNARITTAWTAPSSPSCPPGDVRESKARRQSLEERRGPARRRR